MLCLLTVSCDGSRESVQEVWRFAIEESPGSVQHHYAVEFEKRIEEATSNRVDVVIYPYGTLGTSTQITEQLNLGIVELAMASPGSLGKFIPEMQAFLLHFVLPTDEASIDQLLSNSELLGFLDRLYAEKGIKLLSMYSEGQMVWTVNRPLRSPDDFSGLKMRVMTSPLLIAAYDAYRASPTPLPYSQVYSGLQLKMIDGQVNPLFAIERQKFHEVTSWLILPGHTSFITSCAANLEFYEGLSTEDRQLVEMTIADLQQEIYREQTELQWTSLRKIIRDKIRKGEVLNVIGDLEPFLASLSPEEREELVDQNEFLNIEPPLTQPEVEVFRDASGQARATFLRIGGARSREVLDLLETLR